MIIADPDMLLYPDCVELAIHAAVPVPVGVSTPPDVIVPPVAVQVTAELYAPVPWTVALQVEVCAVVIEVGEAATVIKVTIGGGTVTVIVADPDWVGSCMDLAVMVAVPAAAGVKTPVPLIPPTVDGPIDQITAELGPPVPTTCAVHDVVCAVVIAVGKQETVTEVTVGGGALTNTETAELEVPPPVPVTVTW